MNTLELICELVRMHPVTSDTAAVNRVEHRMREALEKAGIFCTMERVADGRDVLYACTKPAEKTPDLLLNAHLDVVPAASASQYEPAVRGNLLFARGAADCLGNAVCIAEILIRSKAAEASVGAFFSADEETGGETTGAMVKLGYGAKKLALILDGNVDDGIAIAQKGILSLRLIAHGRAGHASRPWCFENPVDKLVRGYGKLLSVWKNPEENDVWHDSMAACVISGGSVHNQIPETAELVLNFRFVEEDGAEKIEQLVRKITGLETAAEYVSPVVAFPGDEPRLTALLSTMQAHFPEKTLAFHRMCGATDARHLKSLGVPVGVIGVAGSGEHSAEESLSLDSFRTYSDILTEFISSLH